MPSSGSTCGERSNHMSSKKYLLVSLITRIVVVAAVLLVAFAIFGYLVGTRPQPETRDPDAVLRKLPAFESRRLAVHRVVEGYGVARTLDSADVPARVTATVVEVPNAIEAGATVEAGDLLARLEGSDFERDLEIATERIADLTAQLNRITIETASWTRRVDMAREAVELAEAEVARIQVLVTQEAARPREAEIARQALIRAIRDEVAAEEELAKLPVQKASLVSQKAGQQAALRQASENLARCTIISPIAGTIQSVDIELGEAVATGSRIARVSRWRTA